MEQHIKDGEYRIRCLTENKGFKSMEAFPLSDGKIKPRMDLYHQDQKWNVQNVENGKYRIYCWTQNGGKRYLEAFPNSELAKLGIEDRIQDQLWTITPWPIEDGSNKFYHITCDTQNAGIKSLEAFPGNDDTVKVKDKSLHQDQKWEFLPW